MIKNRTDSAARRSDANGGRFMVNAKGFASSKIDVGAWTKRSTEPSGFGFTVPTATTFNRQLHSEQLSRIRSYKSFAQGKRS